MAYGTITMSMTVSPTNTILKGANTVTAYIDSVTGSLPSGGYLTGGYMTISSISTYSTNEPYFRFTHPSDSSTVYASTEGMTYNQTAHSETLDLYELSAAILYYGAGDYIGLHFYGVSNTANAMNFRSSTVTLTLNYYYNESSSYSASTGTLNTNTVAADGSSTITMTISGSVNSCSHQIVWGIGSYSSTTTVAVGNNTGTLTVPLSWNNAITTSTSGTATATLKTFYNGTLIGQNSYNFTVTVPASVVPSVGTVTNTLDSDSTLIKNTWNIYVQNNSYTTIAASGCAGVYGSTIRSYKFSGQNLSTTLTSSSASASAKSSKITASGSLTYTVTVTDSRGRTASKTTTLTCYAYSPPVLSGCNAFKCNSSGTATESGLYIRATSNVSCSSCNSKNSVTWKWEYSTNGTTWTTAASALASGATSTVGGSLSASYYQARFTATDALGTISQVITQVSIAGLTMFFKSGGNGIGIGMQTTKGQNVMALEISPNWDIYHGTYTVPTFVVSSSTPAVSAGTIWLKPVT